jgi:hypothetical protein
MGLKEPKSRRNMEANLKVGRLGRECAQVFVAKKARNELKMRRMMRGNYGGLSENDERGVTNVLRSPGARNKLDGG